MYKAEVEEIMTRIMVRRMQMEARLAPFLFILYAMEDTETKCVVL